MPMPIIGIIAEYNPFHHGHMHQIREIRRLHPSARIVVVMSGAFTQRGLPSILDKWTRATCACRHGADLVIELPAVFAVRSAQDFARGGIALLHRLGCIDYVAFGTESPLPALSAVASALEKESTQATIQRYIQGGDAYAVAVTKTIAKHHLIDEHVLRAPNNILGIEYLRSLHILQSAIAPLAIARTSADHNDMRLQQHISSASAIRRACQETQPPWNTIRTTVPRETCDALQLAATAGYPSMEMLYRLLTHELLTQSATELEEITGITEGIEYRLRQAAKIAQSYSDFVDHVQVRRFPYSRIQRLLTHILLHFTKADAAAFDETLPSYVRPLAFQKDTPVLSNIKETSCLPIVSRIASVLSEAHLTANKQGSLLQRMIRYDLLASDLQALSIPSIGTRRRDYTQSPICL